MFQVIFTLISVVGASVHLAFSPKRRSGGAAIAGTYLLYLLFFYVGTNGSAHCVWTRLPSH
jgi:lipopolysaccharide export LptBFGC system permease protein LptF